MVTVSMNSIGQQVGLWLRQILHQIIGRRDRLIIDVLHMVRGIVDAFKHGFMRGDKAQQLVDGQREGGRAKFCCDRSVGFFRN